MVLLVRVVVVGFTSLTSSTTVANGHCTASTINVNSTAKLLDRPGIFRRMVPQRAIPGVEMANGWLGMGGTINAENSHVAKVADGGPSKVGRGGEVSAIAALGIAIVVLGVVVGSVDNVVRPMLSRIGKLQLPAFLLFLALLGGMTAFGPVGVLLGPLLVRLAVEALTLSRELRDADTAPLPAPPSSNERRDTLV